MKGEKFEKQLYDLYEREGFEVSLTPKTNDKGVDLLLEKGGRTVAVQAKGFARENKVGSSAVQKASGLLTRSDIDEVIVATSSSFTAPAREIAENRGVELRRFRTGSRRTNERTGFKRFGYRLNEDSASSRSPTYSDRTTEAEEYTCPNCGETFKRTGWSPYYHHFENCELPDEKPEQLSENQWSKIQERIEQSESGDNDSIRGTTSKSESGKTELSKLFD